MKCSCPNRRWWCVWRRHYSTSAFNAYRRAWSAKSDVACERCGASWRTSAKYVESLPDYDSAYFLARGEFRLSPRARAVAIREEIPELVATFNDPSTSDAEAKRAKDRIRLLDKSALLDLDPDRIYRMTDDLLNRIGSEAE